MAESDAMAKAAAVEEAAERARQAAVEAAEAAEEARGSAETLAESLGSIDTDGPDDERGSAGGSGSVDMGSGHGSTSGGPK